MMITADVCKDAFFHKYIDIRLVLFLHFITNVHLFEQPIKFFCIVIWPLVTRASSIRARALTHNSKNIVSLVVVSSVAKGLFQIGLLFYNNSILEPTTIFKIIPETCHFSVKSSVSGCD